MSATRTIDANDPAIRQAARYLSDATGLLILAGAGIGVDSGLPDFRGDTGFWRAYPLLRDAGIRLTDIAAPQAFVDDPALAWGFYGQRLALYRETVPHAGFAILSRWAEAMRDGWWVSTTNIDGQFQKAGFGSEYVDEIHGTIHALQCTKPCDAGTWSAATLRPAIGEDLRWRDTWPLCRRCGAAARPNVLMFGDAAWVGTDAEARHWQLVEWLDAVERLAIVEIGAGTALPTLRRFGERLVQRRGASLIRINPRESEVSLERSIGIALGAREGLTAIDQALKRST